MAMAHGILNTESGVHPVQRVPAARCGRIHTSAATVVVLPEADESWMWTSRRTISRKDLFCSSRPRRAIGQHHLSAVRRTHLRPVSSRSVRTKNHRSSNYEKGASVLRSRIYEMELNKRLEERAKNGRPWSRTGDRSAKIRTYNGL